MIKHRNLVTLFLLLSSSAAPLHASGYWAASTKSYFFAALLAPLIFSFIIFLGIGVFSSFSKIEEMGSNLWKLLGLQIFLWLLHSSLASIFTEYNGGSFLMATVLSCICTVYFLAKAFNIANTKKFWLLVVFALVSILQPLIFLIFSVFGA